MKNFHQFLGENILKIITSTPWRCSHLHFVDVMLQDLKSSRRCHDDLLDAVTGLESIR
jgi:hypothetical protein